MEGREGRKGRGGKDGKGKEGSKGVEKKSGPGGTTHFVEESVASTKRTFPADLRELCSNLRIILSL